jgi:tripartite ATP-independent transporter DctM subunit
MSDPHVGLLLVGISLILLAVRVPIGATLIAVPFAGIYYLFGWQAAIGTLKAIPYNFAASWELSSVPLFLFMGYLAYHAGLTKGLFAAAQVWLTRLPGGLAIASVFGAAGFATVTGSSVACSAAMGRIAIPEMLKANYDPRLAAGTVAAAGTIGALIPPSILLILYGVMAQVSIANLFMAGVGVGVLTAISYIFLIIIWATVRPGSAPRLTNKYSLGEKLRMLAGVTPTLIVASTILAGLFTGILTPTEAGAVGATLVTLITLVYRTLTWERFKISIVESLTTTASIFVIAIGASLLARFVTITGTGDYIAVAVAGMSTDPTVLMLGIVVIYMLLGTFLEPIGAMLLTLPVLLPIANVVGYDPIWLGIIIAKLLEMGMITPPVGMNVFVLKNSVGDSVSMGGIFYGATYFLIADLAVVGLIIRFPAIAMYLPRLLA